MSQDRAMTDARHPSVRPWLALTVAAMATVALTLPAAAQSQKQKHKRQRQAAPVVELVLPPAPGEQIAAASMTHFGDYECEFDQKINVDLNKKFDGYVEVHHLKSTWIMKPVLSQTGALRLEDVRGRMLMLQIANKSMLMDTQVGQRVVDNCVHEKQREAMAHRTGPEESIGIDPVKAAAAASAAAAAAAAAVAAASAPAPAPGSASAPTMTATAAPAQGLAAAPAAATATTAGTPAATAAGGGATTAPAPATGATTAPAPAAGASAPT
jgi:hypothetical protein